MLRDADFPLQLKIKKKNRLKSKLFKIKNVNSSRNVYGFDRYHEGGM